MSLDPILALFPGLRRGCSQREGIDIDGDHYGLEGQPPPATGGTWWPPR